jgi:flotillin
VSLANSEAVSGENEAKVKIAESEAIRREREAEAMKRAITAEKIAEAKAREDAYAAQRLAELARAQVEKAKLEADVIISAEIEKQQRVIAAEAEAEQIRARAKGEADAILLRKQAEAEGIRAMLSKQAEGFRELIESAGGQPSDAIRLMIADKLEEIVKIQVEAIKNLKIDKVTVWDSGSSQSGDGKSSTANFVSGIMKAIPPMNDLFDLAGMNLPEYLGTEKEQAELKPEQAQTGST